MAELGIYLISMGLVVLGSMGLVLALGVRGLLRTGVACIAALVPIGAGVYLFHSAGLQVADLKPLLHQASADLQLFLQGLQESRWLQGSISAMKRAGEVLR